MNENQYVVDDLTNKDTWRMFLILSEFVEGFETMPEVYPAVTFFGSARTPPNDKTYKTTELLARSLVKKRLQYCFRRRPWGYGGG